MVSECKRNQTHLSNKTKLNQTIMLSLHFQKFAIDYFCIIFQQSFTSNWPKALWLAVDQRGLHLLEHRTRHILCNYEYATLISVSPTLNCLMVVTGTDSKPSKVILNTHQVKYIL